MQEGTPVLSKTDLSNRVAEKTSLSQAKANQVVSAVFDTITETLSRGEEVRLTGFGTFRLSERKERMGRHPRTGEPMTVPAGVRPAFSAGTRLTEAVRGRGKKAV
jgi:DNA-binding protein HU-beta